MDANTFAASVDETAGYELSDNVAEDLIYVSRGSIIGNEEQYLLTAYQSITGYFHDMENYVNVCLMGPSGGGKTMLQRQVLKPIPDDIMYGDGKVTDFSDNAPLDDPTWDLSLLAPLDEYDKISKPIREYMKSMAGEDGGYVKKRNVEDQDSDTGYSPASVSSTAMPYQFLYAPENKQEGLDNELSNRLLKLDVDDDKWIREAIGRNKAGHTNIVPRGLDNEYIYDTTDAERAIRSHLRRLGEKFGGFNETHEDGTLTAVRGHVYTQMPDWIWYACKPIFEIESTHTNRAYSMIFSLMRASAAGNHHTNEVERVERDGEMVDALVVEPQDVANILCTQETLLGTTHLLTERKRDILDAVKGMEGRGDTGGGATLDNVRNWLKKNDKTVPSESVLRRILKEELKNGYYVRVNEGAGPNGADLYEYRPSGALSAPQVFNLQDVADDDNVEIDTSYVDPTNPFEGTWDPIRDQPFLDTVDMFEEDFGAGEDVESRSSKEISKVSSLADAMGDHTQDDDGDGNATFDSFSEDDEDDEPAITLPADPVVQAVYERMVDTLGEDGKMMKADHATDHHLVGVLEGDETVENASLSETIYSPTHELWSHEDIDEERVTTREEAERNIDDAISELQRLGIFELDTDVDAGEQFVLAKMKEIDN